MEASSILTEASEPTSKRRKITTYGKRPNNREIDTAANSLDFIIDDVVNFPVFKKASPPAQAESKKSKSSSQPRMEQLYLDLGQKNFGSITCEECGMLYNPGKDADEKAHTKFHKQQKEKCIEFVGWKNERVVKTFTDGSRIIVVEKSDPTKHIKKVEQIKDLINKELGCNGLDNKNEEKTFLYVGKSKKVLGCAIVEPISEGFPLITTNEASNSDDSVVRCSKIAQPAVCGINRIWVHESARRSGVATKMMDVVLSTFIYGYDIPKERVAFTQPTPEGKQFFKKYIGNESFLVYT